jgi:hypothetical protein
MDTKLVTQNTLLIDSLDALLVKHPFGNSEYITEEMHASYKRRLRKISAHLPVAGQLLNTLSQAGLYSQYRVIGDTVVRCAVQHAHKQVETGIPYGLPLDQCAEVFQATVQLLEEGKCAPLGSGLSNRVGPESHHGWIWSEERSDDVFTRALRYLTADNYGDEPLCSPASEELATFEKAVQLLSELLPQSSRSALSHVHLVVVFAADKDSTPTSSSEFRLSGSIFLSRKLLANPWWVAEHLFHEALHQQLYDFRSGHSLLIPDFAREGAPRICSLWNMPDSIHGNYWDVHRAIAALHVYVHLALLATLAEQRSPEKENTHTSIYGPNKMVGSRIACARAHYLVEQLRLPIHWHELGPAGKRVVDWFDSILEAVDPSPPPEGSCVHLLLDRYWREARQVEILLTNDASASQLSNQLTILAKDEMESAHSILAAANAQTELSSFDQAFASVADDEPGKEFVRARDLIVETFLHVSPSTDGYNLSASGVADEMVKQMVERSSESLRVMLGR